MVMRESLITMATPLHKKTPKKTSFFCCCSLRTKLEGAIPLVARPRGVASPLQQLQPGDFTKGDPLRCGGCQEGKNLPYRQAGKLQQRGRRGDCSPIA